MYILSVQYCATVTTVANTEIRIIVTMHDTDEY